jgi:hypothetical protein
MGAIQNGGIRATDRPGKQRVPYEANGPVCLVESIADTPGGMARRHHEPECESADIDGLTVPRCFDDIIGRAPAEQIQVIRP